MNIWAGVVFIAEGGRTSRFLQCAAQQHLKLRDITPIFGGVKASVAARHYKKVARLAKRNGVHTKIQKKYGVYFKLRPLFSHVGVVVGALCFLAVWLVCRNFVWQIDCVGLTIGQEARVKNILWENCQIAPGAYQSEALLAKGRQALMEQGSEFSWVSLNFYGGRLTVEAAPAKAVPQIAQGNAQDILAKVNAKIVKVNVQSGTAAVAVGQEVVQGQVLVSMAKVEHDQISLVYEPTAATVEGEFVWQGRARQPICEEIPIAQMSLRTKYSVFFAGRQIALDCINVKQSEDELQEMQSADEMQRQVPVEAMGFHFPMTLLETTLVPYQVQHVEQTQSLAQAKARLACVRALYVEYPDATIIETQEQSEVVEGVVEYQVSYRVIADITD